MQLYSVLGEEPKVINNHRYADNREESNEQQSARPSMEVVRCVISWIELHIGHKYQLHHEQNNAYHIGQDPAQLNREALGNFQCRAQQLGVRIASQCLQLWQQTCRQH